MDDLTALPAHQLAELVRAREVSAAEVLAAHLDRLEAVNPRLNAVVQVAPDAVDRAAAADAALARGEDPGPLHGVPFTAKDNLETRGVVTAIGVPERAATVPAADTAATLAAAGGALAGAGAAVEEAAPPGDGHALTREVWRSYGHGMARRPRPGPRRPPGIHPRRLAPPPG